MDKLSHIDEDGAARMVDVSNKSPSKRTASAQATVQLKPATILLIRQNALAKGDVLAVARVAGIMAAKRTDELIPLCHTLPISSAIVDFEVEESSIRAIATVTTFASTGVEMEALSSAVVSALTIYDMVKAVDKSIVISDVHLLTKTGGQRGDFYWPN